MQQVIHGVLMGLLMVLASSYAYAQTARMAGLYVPAEIAAKNAQEAAQCALDESRAKPLGVGRYGAPFIEAFCEGDVMSYQERVLSKGLAVLSMPEMGAYPKEWRAAQAKARQDKYGIWASLSPISSEEISNLSSFPEWAFVHGIVHSVTKRDFGTYINFSEDWKTDFTVFVHKTHRRDFKKEWWNQLVGRDIEVMGALYNSYGPMMDITHSSQVMFRK